MLIMAGGRGGEGGIKFWNNTSYTAADILRIFKICIINLADVYMGIIKLRWNII